VTPAPTELAALVAWAIRAAKARAHVKGLPADGAEDAALQAVFAALRTHDPAGAPLAAHVRRRVRGALLDLARAVERRGGREVLLDDLEEPIGPGIEHDEEGLGRVAGVEAPIVGSPEASLLRREQQTALDREVDKLPRADRHLYVLRHRKGLAWDAIAAATGLAARTARLHDKRIRDHLTATLRARDEAG
jgi:DNA-directed RNA polymerase specialized sigma24 family protein